MERGLCWISIVAPNPSKGGSFALERHMMSGASLFVDGSVYAGALLPMGGVRIRRGGPRLVSPFAHLQAGAFLIGYGLTPLASCGVGLDAGGTATVPRMRVQVDGLFTTEGAAVRISVGLLWPVERSRAGCGNTAHEDHSALT